MEDSTTTSTMTLSYVTIPAEDEAASPSRSCFRRSSSSFSISSSCSTATTRRRVRLTDEPSHVHMPPAALMECLANPEERRAIWYNGNDIRRIKQACVPVISRLDNKQPVHHAVESDWQTGTTSTRGLEFGTREGHQRKRSSLQFQRIVLQEQARLKQQNQDGEEYEPEHALAVKAREASQASVQMALELAIQDAAFVCQYVENVTHDALLHTTRPVRPLAWMRKVWRAAASVRQNRALVRKKKTLDCEGRPRCDTESTATYMACSS